MTAPVFVRYDSPAERRDAFMHMVGMRQQWEEHVKDLVEKRKQHA